MKRDRHQRIAYGLTPMSRAVDRGIRARTDRDKAQALAWAKIAKVVQHGG